jgi:hypothetical protein
LARRRDIALKGNPNVRCRLLGTFEMPMRPDAVRSQGHTEAGPRSKRRVCPIAFTFPVRGHRSTCVDCRRAGRVDTLLGCRRALAFARRVRGER